MSQGKIIVSSQAWPEELRSQYPVSKIHEIFKPDKVSQINQRDISFRIIDPGLMEEVKALHQEWFPIYYSDSYFNRLNDDANSICMGAFYRHKFIVGIFIGTFKYNSMVLKELTNQGWWACKNVCGLYISTIGVVDEVRRLGIGSQLLENVTNWIERNKPQWEVIYLHVVDYNVAAIKFYDRNKFLWYERNRNYYLIGEEYYDSFLYFKRYNSFIAFK